MDLVRCRSCYRGIRVDANRCPLCGVSDPNFIRHTTTECRRMMPHASSPVLPLAVSLGIWLLLWVNASGTVIVLALALAGIVWLLAWKLGPVMEPDLVWRCHSQQAAWRGFFQLFHPNDRCLDPIGDDEASKLEDHLRWSSSYWWVVVRSPPGAEVIVSRCDRRFTLADDGAFVEWLAVQLGEKNHRPAMREVDSERVMREMLGRPSGSHIEWGVRFAVQRCQVVMLDFSSAA